MSEWKVAPFKSFFAIGLRNGLTKPMRVRGSGVRMVNMKEIFAYDVIDDTTPMELVPVSEKEYEASVLLYNDLLFARQSLVESGAGKIAIFKGNSPTVFESHLIRCRIDKVKACADYVYYLFKSPVGKSTVSTIVQQTAAAGIRGSDLENLEFRFPPLQIQKAIAEVLSSLDDKISLLTRQNATIETLSQTYFRQWFVEYTKDEAIKYSLSELMTFQNGFAFRSKDYLDAGKYKVITIKNVQDGFIDTSGTAFLQQLPNGISDNMLLATGDVLMSLTGNVGRVAIVTEDNLLLNQRVAKIMPKNPEHLPFLYFYFRNDTIKEYLINLAHGTAQANLSPIEALKTIISFDKSSVQSYSEFIRPMYQKIISNKQQVTTLQKLRDTLLPKLISGEARVKQQEVTGNGKTV